MKSMGENIVGQVVHNAPCNALIRSHGVQRPDRRCRPEYHAGCALNYAPHAVRIGLAAALSL
jgi:hypothetical protein